jgi:serine/threonine protein kinase
MVWDTSPCEWTADMGVFSSLKQFIDQAIKRSSLPRVDLAKRFELTPTPGQGSMSKVYWARDRQLGRVVCVKVLDKDITARFEASFKGKHKPTEGAICMALQHPNIVRTHEYGLTTAGQYFIVMDMIEGARLDVLIDTKSRQLAGNRIKFLVQVAEGLEYIHQQKFVHRDLSPRNILVDHAGVAKIFDFGLTLPFDLEFTKPGDGLAMPDYTAPESFKRVTPYMDPALFRKGRADHRIDLFGLGVTAYETLTGRLPWEEAASVSARVRDPREFVPKMDADTADFLMNAIHADLNERFRTAREMKEELKALPAR